MSAVQLDRQRRSQPAGHHRQHIARMFDQIARRYDLLNDILSLGLHRLARRRFLAALAVKPGQRVLDLCAGTGDLARRAAARGAEVVLADASPAMLLRARRLVGDRAQRVVADALQLPFADCCFDAVMVGFALRNVATLEGLFSEARRVLRPSGLLATLEFSQPSPAIRPLFRAYLLTMVPLIGSAVSGQAYGYLARSVANVPSADCIAEAMRSAGLRDVHVTRMFAGVLAVHVARK